MKEVDIKPVLGSSEGNEHQANSRKQFFFAKVSQFVKVCMVAGAFISKL